MKSHWHNGVLLLIFLMTSPFVVHGFDGSETFQEITRLNYGVVFREIRSVHLVCDTWSHIFDLQLPDIITDNARFEIPRCDNSTSNEEQDRIKRTCERNRAVILELHKQHVNMMQQITSALQHIYHLLPTVKHIAPFPGQKRSLLPIGGVLLNQLFGTATETDLRPIKDHITRIAQGISHLGHGLQLQQHQFASFVEISAERMDAFANLSLTQEHALTELRNEFRALYESEAEDQERLIMALNKVQKYVNHLRYIDELRQSVEYLIHGTLTPQLVPKLSLRTILLGIKAHLRRYHSNSHLIFEHATDFYAKSRFHFGRHDKHLLIHLQIPVTTFDYKFQIFKVTTFPVFVTGRTSHATTVLNLPRYFVTSQHGTHFFTLNEDDTSIHPALLYIMGKDIVFKDILSGASCVSALFINNLTQIRELCSFVLEEKPLPPSILSLQNGKILMTNISTYSLDCNLTKTRIVGCTQCVRQVPCNCGIKLSSENPLQPRSFWLPRRYDCPHTVNVTTTEHIVNLATLQAFFHDSLLGDLTGDSYLSKPLSVQLPAFRHFRHEFQNFLSTDTFRSHNLQKFSRRVKNQSHIFDNLAEVLLHQSFGTGMADTDLLISSQITNASFWLLWSAILCAYTSLAIAIYLCYRLKTGSSILPVLAAASATQTAKFPSHLTFGDSPKELPIPSNATQSAPCFIFDRTIVIDLVTVIIIGTFVIIMLLFWLYRVLTVRHKLYLVLEIGDRSQSVRIKCLQLSSVIYGYTFRAPEYIKSLSTTGIFPAYLSVDWPSFSLLHITGGMAIDFPRKITIPPWTKRRIQRILHANSFYVLVLLQSNGNFRLIDFESQPTISDSAVFVGEADRPDKQPNPPNDAVTPPVPLHLYTSMSPLPIE